MQPAIESGKIAPGDWRSPQPSQAEVERGQQQRNRPPPELPGIDLNTAEQLELAKSLPMAEPKLGPRYAENGFFHPHDAAVLRGILRMLQPRSVVEVGSGYSSAVMLDTHDAAYTFIDPEPARLRSLLLPDDRPAVMEQPVQDVSLDLFCELERDDILFVDSSHISKMGSDVNHILFEILPRLRPGV